MFFFYLESCWFVKIVSEYDQEIPQSQTADNSLAPRGRALNIHALTLKAPPEQTAPIGAVCSGSTLFVVEAS